MGNGFQFIEVILFAVVAGFLIFRLRSVLGRRHGEEQQRPNPFSTPRPGQSGQPDAGAGGPIHPLPDNVIPLPQRDRAQGEENRWGKGEAAVAGEAGETLSSIGQPRSLAASLARLRALDPNFEEKHFLAGSRMAFEMIVEAFARGNLAVLRPLLNEEVFRNFADSIRQREHNRETLETRLDRIREAEIIEAEFVDASTVRITVKFVSDQMNVTRDTTGTVLEGDPSRAFEVTDIWTFSRNIRSRDPNWTLVATAIPN
jgi:predicted lipid-binding transport protein (Tim44 family)